MMRRILPSRVLQIPYVLTCTATSFSTGNNGSSRRQQRERSVESFSSDYDISNRVIKTENTRTSSNSITGKVSSGKIDQAQLLFPDAQGHELDDVEVNTEEENTIFKKDIKAEAEEEEEEEYVPTNIKKKYDRYHKPKPKTMVLTSSFAGRTSVKPINDEFEDVDDVTQIYDSEEVNKGNYLNQIKCESPKFSNIPRQSTMEISTDEIKEDIEDITQIHESINIIKTLKGKNGRNKTNLIESHRDEEKKIKKNYDEVNENCEIITNRKFKDDRVKENDKENDDEEEEQEQVMSKLNDEDDEFKNVRKHSFFTDLLCRMEKNAIRQRQQIKTSGRYNLDAVNLCLRPLLQVTDYPFTVNQLNRLAPFLYLELLKKSLSDIKACRRLHIYLSSDTNIILDWSIEDFLRRRYESIHLSWEPVKIVMMRFGWNQEVMTDRDCLLYFSKFRDFIELAELELSSGDENPKALPIEDPLRVAEQRPISVSKLLIRRKPTEETEPSVTESIRLMGTPALSKPTKSKKAKSIEKDSVEGTLESIQREAATVDGDEETKLRHGIHAVPSLRQAVNPSGRSIKEFSLGNIKNTVISSTVPHSSTRVEGNPFDEGHRNYTPETYEALANVYHKKKVEASQMRRRLLSTDSIDQASEIQEKLALAQKELPRLREKLEKMRQLRRMEKETISGISQNTFNRIENYINHKKFENQVEKSIPLKENHIEKLKEQQSSTILSSPIQFEKVKEETEKNYNAAEGNINDSISRKEQSKKETNNTLQLNSIPASDEIKSLSSAAIKLRHEIETMQQKRRQEEEVLLQKMGEALNTLLKIESTIKSVSQRGPREAEVKAELNTETEEKIKAEMKLKAAVEAEAKLKAESEMKAKAEAEAKAKVEAEERKRLELQLKEEAEQQKKLKREQAEARARALEQDLLRQHEERRKLLLKLRDEAREAQRAAEIALIQQKQAEKEALEAEAELERNLQEAKSKIWSNESDEVTIVEPIINTSKKEGNTVSVSIKDNSENNKGTTNIVTKREESKVSSSSSSELESNCSPEQYDGLCLGAERLRKEIAELERQMENEGDEDDMTLMSVLAASRSDLEELEDFICEVQRRESWTLDRDKARKEEEERQASQRGERTNDVQETISAIRFQTELLEKRLQHATERSVIKKLEQTIINNRREINKLRVEQDRLRRSGQHADAGGLRVPSSVSIAEALAHEEKNKFEEENLSSLNEIENTCKEEELEAQNENEPEDINGEANIEHFVNKNLNNNTSTNTDTIITSNTLSSSSSFENNEEEYIPIEETDEKAVAFIRSEQQELRQLTNRMETMLMDIRQLEGKISSHEGDDAEATAISLYELQQKLKLLLEMRDTVKQRMKDTPLDINTTIYRDDKFINSAVKNVGNNNNNNNNTNITTTPTVIAPLSIRPVWSPKDRAGTEVLRFQHDTSNRNPASGRKSRKVSKNKKARR